MKYKKKYINLKWFAYTVASEYRYLFEKFSFNYIGKDKVIIKSHLQYKKMARIMYIIRRTSKNCFNILHIETDMIKNLSCRTAKETIQYISDTYRIYKIKPKG